MNLEQPLVQPHTPTDSEIIRGLLPKRIRQMLEQQGEPILDANGRQVSTVPVDPNTIKLAITYLLKIDGTSSGDDEDVGDALTKMNQSSPLFENNGR